MTIIRQVGITTHKEETALAKLINDSSDVLLIDTSRVNSCGVSSRWMDEMSLTRQAFGHDVPSRNGRNGKPARNTILYHQTLAFLPNECDVNGGLLTPEDCMRYAVEYADTYYEPYEVVIAIRDELCEHGPTRHYVAHVIINRSNLKTGNRLDEGTGKTAAMDRVHRIILLDKRWGLERSSTASRI